MPLRIPNGLPARRALEVRGIRVINETEAARQDVRELRVAICVLMPLMSVTEEQILALLSNTALQVKVTFIFPNRVRSPRWQEHISRFYKTFEDVRSERFDLLILTGAPVEDLPFSEVSYWDDIRSLLDWSLTNVHTALHICWGAQAALHHHFGIHKRDLPEKLSGVFEHAIEVPGHPLFHGFDDTFLVPHSRRTDIVEEELAKQRELVTLARSKRAGAHLLSGAGDRLLFVSGHHEYVRHTLAEEWRRDVKVDSGMKVPENYFPSNDPTQTPLMQWRTAANLLFGNLLNNVVYPRTPFDLRDLTPIT